MTFQAPPSEQPRGDSTGAFPFYLNWHAQGSASNGIGAACFSIRESGPGNSPMTSQHMVGGTVWDIENIETGWQSWPQGGTKEYRANPTLATPLPYPGAGWGEAIKIPMALDATTAACWDQASTGSWKGFCQIAAIIAQQAPANPGLLPVIRLIGATLTSTGQNSTQVPNFEIMKWVPRPACLSVEAVPVAAAPPPVVPAPMAPVAPVPPPVVPAPAPVAPAPAPAPVAPAPVAPVGAWN
jgi:hypothetical protein